MKPQRPYLLRAYYDWILDSGEVPFVVVDATLPEVQVPAEHVQNGQIVLNVGPDAVRDLNLGDDYVMFSSRFNGQAMEIVLPMASVRAIYCKDNGQGLVFPDEDYTPPQGVVGAEPPADDAPAATGLGVADADESGTVTQLPGKPVADDNGPDDDPPKKPGLRLV